RHTRWPRDWSSDVCSSDLEYVEELRDLLDQAVSDRLRTTRIGIFLSGGLDSAILAATAVRRLVSPALDPIHGFSFAYGSLIDDRSEERRVGKECRFRVARG